MTTERVSRSVLADSGLGVETPTISAARPVGSRIERWAGNVFILPAVLVVLFLSIFPLFLSLSLSLSRLKFVKGGFEINFVGLANYHKLLFGSEQDHFVGVIASPSPLGWAFFLGIVAFLVWWLVRYIRTGGYGVVSLVGRVLTAVLLSLLAWLLAHTLSPGGRPGTVVVTLLYVFIGIAVQYALGLLLAVLTTQRLPARRFFRVVFLLPMMITPVGIAYTFRMMTDTDKGPFQPIWQALGLGLYSWVNDPWGARAAVIISDIWQWTPFMFIVLLAALEGQSVELMEAALVDGANRWQVFWHITLPQILPVSTTLILIRMIEAFKIVDLPNVLTNGGPGTATESMTLHAFIAWRTLDLGGSAAIAYMLLFMVTFLSMSYVNILRRRVVEA
ncbi:MAG: sugar ABC transporter permease [Ardenticatenia bacterium]|nr:MAG: sugar ABC transporter permease [Ardenticatenia bacterium]